ncbi:hypothetical protein AMJ47_03705 [Parcubacteria bacterium DG_72]|nr:MAG: hypothetical protein AMJ47_03705 [Parcubacteria bacterium DG_72]
MSCEKRFNKLLGTSANALASNKIDKVLPINDKFQFVIDMAEGTFPDPDNPKREGTMNFLQGRALEAGANVALQEEQIREEAEREISFYSTGQDIGQAVFDKAVESLFATKKAEDENLQAMIRKAFGYQKAVELAREQLAQIKRKRADYLANQVQKQRAVAV